MSTNYGWDVMPTPEGSNLPRPGIEPTPTRPATGIRRLLGAGVAICLMGLIGGIGVGWSLSRSNASAPSTVQAPITGVPQSTDGQASAAQPNGSLNLQAITAKVDRFVVDINTQIVTGNGSGSAAGTGIILTAAGEVLTNNHVVEGATSIKVSIAGGSGSYNAHVVGVDPTADVALIQIEGVTGLPTATIADSSTVTLGQSIAAIGNAGGRGGTPSVSQGSVIALNQSITASAGNGTEQLTGMIEINADIAAGESGGPLVNSIGQVIGIITAGQTQGFRSSTATIGFAIPTNSALSIANQIRSGRASSQVILGQVGYLGVQVSDLDAATAAQLGLSAASGALVVGLVPGSPAEGAGLGQGAVITAVSGTGIESSATLGTILHGHKPGDRVAVTWIDSAGTHTATMSLTTGPAI